jgi:catechol 2,3-dioxygenase-like lactoylglutathione lyase family enzyme
MIDHITLHVKDYQTSKRFYLAALAPLGYELIMEFGIHGGLGVGGKPDLWLGSVPAGATVAHSSHVAFVAADHASVDAFYEAALAAGAKDNGPPGPRPHYHAKYYGAFVIDPDGHNIEAVCHK